MTSYVSKPLPHHFFSRESETMFSTRDLSDFDLRVCNCIGPQRGEPLCPCRMAGVFQRDGRWVQAEVDLGPVVPWVDYPKR